MRLWVFIKTSDIKNAVDYLVQNKLIINSRTEINKIHRRHIEGQRELKKLKEEKENWDELKNLLGINDNDGLKDFIDNFSDIKKRLQDISRNSVKYSRDLKRYFQTLKQKYGRDNVKLKTILDKQKEKITEILKLKKILILDSLLLKKLLEKY